MVQLMREAELAGRMTASDVKHLTVYEKKPFDEGAFGQIYTGRITFKDGSRKRVAVKIFYPHTQPDDKIVREYEQVIRKLVKSGASVPKTGFYKHEGKWVQVTSLFGSISRGSKLKHWGAARTADLRNPALMGDIGRQAAKILNAGYFPSIDAIHYYDTYPGEHKVITFDIDNLVAAQQERSIKELLQKTPEEKLMYILSDLRGLGYGALEAFGHELNRLQYPRAEEVRKYIEFRRSDEEKYDQMVHEDLENAPIKAESWVKQITDETGSKDLIAARLGDSRAIKKVFDSHEGLIARILIKENVDRSDADFEDLKQEARVSLLEAIRSYDLQNGAPFHEYVERLIVPVIRKYRRANITKGVYFEDPLRGKQAIEDDDNATRHEITGNEIIRRENAGVDYHRMLETARKIL